jgi:hypothetical protein
MQQPEQQPNSAGGTAPADRQCHYTKSDGQPCRNWALRGHHHCFPHHRFIHSRPERPIDVPLLEDQASIVYVLSQTLQSLAWGSIPVTNGRMILAGCRLAHTMQMHQHETAKFRLQLRRLNIPEQEIFDPAPPSQPTAPSAEHDAEPAPNPIKVRPKHIQFRDLKKDWDKQLLKVENEMTDKSHRRYGETQEDFLASRATPFDHLPAQDAEVRKARDLAAALPADNATATINN